MYQNSKSFYDEVARTPNLIHLFPAEIIATAKVKVEQNKVLVKDPNLDSFVELDVTSALTSNGKTNKVLYANWCNDKLYVDVSDGRTYIYTGFGPYQEVVDTTW